MTETEERVDLLLSVFQDFTKEEELIAVAGNRELIENCGPADVALLVDRLVSLDFPMDKIKRGINNLMAVIRPVIENYPYHPPSPESYLGCLLENNRILDGKLENIQPLLKQLNNTPENQEAKQKLIHAVTDLNKYRSYYEIKESILFPEIRKHITEHGCLSVMTSCHNEIKSKLKRALELLSSEKTDLNEFNGLVSELLLIMYEIKFREERILYTIVQDSISEPVLNSLYGESMEIGFPYFQPEGKITKWNKQ
ncbi:MAG: hypothetical protein JW761_10035 [Prolixibacteraceae bacterium]|nr:hypothetical protein [Prolixibacteraceae bacterium]